MADYQISDKQVDDVLVYLRSINRTREQLEDLSGNADAIRELDACAKGIYRVLKDVTSAGPLEVSKLPL